MADLTLVTLTFDPSINGISLLPKMDVWTKFEEGRPRCSRVIDLKRFDTFDHGDLDLRPSDPKIIRVLLLPRANVLTKFEEGRSRRS